ncbi:MAG TPA: enolase C-terminal domain-like protein [Burkholderiales bacterium]|nr:enolase C-terminal domain-like protein [Burkholderiales bacterium]
MKAQSLTIRNLRATPVKVPMTYVLGTSAQAVREAPLLLVDLETEEGITGHAYQFCYLPAAAPAVVILLDEVLRTVKGEPADPAALWVKLSRRFMLIGVQGIVRMAMAMFDAACWDALARAAGLPLASFLGGAPRPVPAYNSCGLGLMKPPALADEAEKLLSGGFRAVKLRLGYPTLEADLAAIRAVRSRVPDKIAVMVDFNQALTVEEAILRGRALEGEGIYWLEEPIRHDDFSGCAAIARALDTPVQIGENFSQVHDMERALAAQACDYVMPDLERIGGVSGWMRASEIAQSHRMKMSSHLYPEISAHLLAVTSTAHWLEYVDWANPVLAEPLRIVDGHAVVSGRPGNGLVWNEDAVRKYRMT